MHVVAENIHFATNDDALAALSLQFTGLILLK
jgi:hypothetical protein